ncbi:MAG TPA: DUF6531 domain-containing protein [Candidatus Sulfotelmatobacter sp.]|nr:DUF6531 domain-containing protein [Candidatus Sulfotelmatobacter sp.]
MNSNIFKRKTLFLLCVLILCASLPAIGQDTAFYLNASSYSAPDNGSGSVTLTVGREDVPGTLNNWNIEESAQVYIYLSQTGTNPISASDVSGTWQDGYYLVTIPALYYTTQVTVPISDDPYPDYDRTGEFTVDNDPGVSPEEGYTSASLTVLDDNNPVGVASYANGGLYSVNYMYEGATGGLNTNDIRFFRDYALSPRTVNYSLSGSTAIAGTDYSPTLGTVTFANGSYYADVAISANNAAQNTNKWLNVQVQGANDYLLWPGGTNLSVEILQDFPAIGLASSASQAQQGQGWELEFYNTNAYTFTPNETVNYTISGTASNGVDYTPYLSGSIVIPAGTGYVITNITTTYYTNFVGNKTLTVTVSPSSDYSIIPSASSSSLDILQEFPAIGLASSASELAQGQEWELEFYNTNAWSDTPAETVNYTVSGTASNGVDYTPYLSGSIVIPAGTYGVITNISTTLHTNLVGTKTVTITVSTNITYSVITNYSSASLGIVPDVSIVSVAAPNVNAFQGGDPGEFAITRTGGLDHTQTVNFVFNGTATNGINYQTLPTNVVFAVGQTSTNLNVVANSSPALSSAETVVLTMATNTTFFPGDTTQAVVTLLPNSDTTNSVISPVGRYWRGTGSDPTYWSMVIPQDGETGTVYSNMYGNAASLYGIEAWNSETYYHYDATNQLEQTNAANRIPFNNPIVAFGERVGGTPLYINQNYSFGIYAGNSLPVEETPIEIVVYNRTNFSTAGFIALYPASSGNTASWNSFTTNGFAVVSSTNYLADGVTGTTNTFGLQTILSYSPQLYWGVNNTTTNGGECVLTHMATAQATNYYYVVEDYGWLDTVGLPMVEDASQDIVPSMLYTLEFEQRPPWRSTFLDQPQFNGSPLPPYYNGMTLAQMMTNTPPVTNGVTILPQNATNLNDSPELLRSPVLDSFVASMGNDPVALANFVINQIDLTDPMDYSDDGNVSEQAIYPTGVSRGALGTFMEREGSPIDQCALLVYLLRQAGVPAVYQFPPSGGMKILTERLSEMFRFQIQGAYTEAGQLYTTNTMITVNYPWVAAYIGTNWVNIFPWLKDYEVTEGLNLWDEMPSNYYNAYPFVHDYIYGNTNLLSLASGGDDTLRVIFPAYLKQTLLQNHPGISVDDIGTQIVNRQHYYARWQDFPTPTYVTNTCISLESLGSSAITNINPALTNIFDTLSVEIYSLNDPTKDIQTGQMPLTALHNREFYIYQTATNGNEVQLSLILMPFNTNTTTQTSFTNDVYLTNKEVLSMTLDQYDNQLNVRFKYYRNRAISAAYAVDPYQTFLGLQSGEQAIEERPIYKGDEAAICLDYGRVTPEMLNVHAANLWNMQNELSTNPSLTNSISPDLYLGEPMYLAGMNYYENVSSFDQVNQNLNKVSVLSTFAMGLSKISPALDSSGNLTNNTVYPVLPNVDMFFDDLAYAGNGTVQPNSGQDYLIAGQNYELLRIVDGSAEEHQIINTFYGQTNAVSTVRLLQIAQSTGAGIVNLNINNFNSEATTVYQGEELSQWDTQMWSDLVSDFSSSSTYGFISAYVTPGPMGNSSYQGMGALVLGWDKWEAIISPESLNGAFGTPFQLTSVNAANTINYNLNNNNNNNFTISFNQPEAGTTLAPTTEPNFAYASTQNAILNDEYAISTFDTSFASSVNSVYGNSTSGDTPVQAFASADQSSQESGFLGDVDDVISQALTDVGDPVQPITGEFYIDTTDLRIPGPLPLSLRRNYSSQNLADNQFGTGWKLSIMPYLSVAMGGTNIYAADMDGAVLAYVQTSTNANVWIPTLAANPQLNNNTSAGAGGMVNRLRDRLVQTVSGTTTNYTLYGCDGSVRSFQVMTFNNGDLNQTRPYLLNWTDSRGNYYNFSYGTNSSQTGFGQMTRILCSNGNYLDFDYDVYGHIVDAYTGDGRWVYYTYDQYNDLVNVTLPDNSTRSYDYLHSTQAVTNNGVVSQVPYSTHLIVEEDKPDGRELVNEYDSQQRVTNQLSTAGADLNPIPTASFTYFNNFNLTNSFTNGVTGYTLIVDGNGNTTRYDYTNSLITKVTYPLGVSIQQTWYPDNATSPGYPRSVATRTDKRGMVTQYEYDSNGNVTNMVTIGDITGDGITTQTATNTAIYNPANNLPMEILDSAGNGMEYVYDPTFTYMPQQTIRLARGVPVSTNFMYYGNATNVVQDGNISQTNMAFGLLTREVRAYNSPDAATNDTIYDGQGFPDETIAYTGTGDPSITNTYFYNERGMMVDSVDALGAVTYCDYDPMNRPTEMENFDEFGNPLSLVLKYYNENGELNWTEGPQYNPDDYVYYDYDGAGRLTTKIQWLSQANSDGSGVSAPSGYNLYAQSFYQYDPLGDLTLAVDPRGAETTNTYDALCRLVSSTHLDTDGQTVLSVDGYSYEPGGEVQSHTNALGGVTTMYYTITGKPEYQINADGSTNGWRYYLDGRTFKEIQGNGAYWQTAYDDLNRRTTRVFYSAAGVPEATNTVYFDRRGNQIQKVDADFNAFTTAFDGLNRVKSTVGPPIITVNSESSGLLPLTNTYVTNVLEESLTNFYDIAGRNVTNINDLGEKTVTTSDAIGRVTGTRIYNSAGALIHENYNSYSPDHNSVTTTNGSGPNAIVNTTYVDTEGHNVLSISYPAAGSMDYTWKTHDLAGNLTYQEQDSSASGTTTGWEGAIFDYDGLNRCIEKIDRNNAVTTYAYDQLSDLTNRTMPGGLQWQAAYNDAGQMLEDQLSGGGDTTRSDSYSYYPAGSPFAGMLETKTDGRDLASTYSYDDWLRPTSITRTLDFNLGIPPIELYGSPWPITIPGSGSGYNHLDTFYAYDVRGYTTNITEQYTGSGTGPDPKVISRTYDPYGQLSSESVSINGAGFSSASQTWDSVGRRTGLNINGANYMYGWNADGTLTYASSPNGSGFYSYDTAGLLTNRLVGARSTSITSRDGEGRPTTEVTSVYGTTQLTENMTWNGDGTLASHVLQRPDFTDSRFYQYNDLSRRLSYEQQNINVSTTWTNDFLYDNGADTMGVLTEMGQPGSAVWNGGVSPLESVDSETNTCTTYPARGRLNGQATLTVMLDGQPLSVTTNSSGDPSYPFEWRTLMELTPGPHQLKVAALHPSGFYTAWATNSFTNNLANATDAITRDGNGNVEQRVRYNAHGTAEDVQYFFWDSKNRLTDLFDYDRNLNGYYMHTEYDGLDRRLLTEYYSITDAVAQVGPTVINQYYDPMVEFQELGVSYGNTTEWKLLGPDLNGQYGGENGTGGFDGVSPGLSLFNPTISDFRGNILGEVTNGVVAWNSARPTGYGAVPGYRPVALAHGADLVQSSAWRGRWVDITGYYHVGERLYDPVAGVWLSYDPVWNEGDPNYLSFCGGDPIMGFDPDGRFSKGEFQGGVGLVEGGATLVWDVGGALGYAVVSPFDEEFAADAYGNQMQGLINMGNGISMLASQASQGDFGDIGTELSGGPDQSAAYRAGYVVPGVASFVFGGEAAETGEVGTIGEVGDAGQVEEASDVSANTTAAASTSSESAEEATVAADQSGQMIQEPAEVPAPEEEVPAGNVPAEESAQAPVAESASASSASTDVAGESSAIADPAQMLQAPEGVDSLAAEGGTTLYRGLAEGESIAGGLVARAPGAGNDVISHVAGQRASQWISTTKSLEIAQQRFGQYGVVAIDASKVTTPIVDVSKGLPGLPNNFMLPRWARATQEVLIQDQVPADAVKLISGPR